MVKKRLVIIDNDNIFVENIKRDFLLSPEIEVVASASSASEGLSVINSSNPDIIIITFPLPDADVGMFLNSFPKQANQIRIVASTTGFENAQNTLVRGNLADFAIGKPYNSNVIQNIVNQNDYNPNIPPIETGIYTKNQAPVNNQGFFTQQPPAFNNTNPSQELNQPNFNFNQGMQNQGFAQQPFMQQPQPQTINQMNMGLGQQPFQNPYAQQSNPYEQNMNISAGPSSNMHGAGFRTLKQTIIAFGCPKGGVGKTTIAKETAVLLSSVKVGGQPLKVLLIDADVEFGDVAMVLKKQTYPSISNWAGDIKNLRSTNPNVNPRFSEEIIKQKYLQRFEETGLYVLAAPGTHSDAVGLAEEDCKIIYQNLLACNFDVIIFDCGNNTNVWTMEAFMAAHYILIITNMEVTTIEDTHKLFNTLRFIHFPMDKIKLIMNAMPRAQKDIDLGEIQGVLKSEIIGVIPEVGDAIRISNNSGRPLVLGRETEFTQSIKKIANTMVPVFGNRAMAQKNNNNNSVPQKQKSLFGFFKK